MSTGYWDLNSQSDYYNYETNYGSYQYQTLDSLINTFLAYYVGENKVIPKAAKEDIAFFARRAAQELSYDTLRSKKTWEVEVNNTMCMPMPHDFVGYTNVYWSSPGGIKRTLYPTRLTQNPFRPKLTDDPFTETITEEEIEQNIPSNTKVYVFYDGTSLGLSQTQDAYNAVTGWLTSIPGFVIDTTQGSPTENVFHTVVQGERWLDWANSVTTGKLNNGDITIADVPEYSGIDAQTLEDHPCPAGSTAEHWNTGGNVGVKAADAINWSASTAGVNQFYDGASPEVQGEQLGNLNPGVVMKGPAPSASSTDDVLIIVFADESNAAYHGETGKQAAFDGDPSADSRWNSDIGGDTCSAPTGVWINDYNKYKEIYSNHTGSFNAFLYPTEPAAGAGESHFPFPLHALAAIHSGNKIVQDGTWTEGTAPTNTYSDLSAIEVANPYWNGANPQYGGLDQSGWGVNVDGDSFTASKFENDLGEFLAGETTTYTEITVETSGQNWYNIDDEGNVEGGYNSSTLQNYQASEDGEPMTLDVNNEDLGYGSTSLGQRYGIEPEQSQVNGSYYMDYANGKIFFAPSLIGQTIVLDYLSDGLDAGGEMLIHKFAEEAFYKHVAYAIVSTGSNYSPATVQMLKKERFAETRKAKIRLSNLKSLELAQVMRGKSKQIKH